MTKRTGGASAGVIEAAETLYDGYRDDVGDAAVPITGLDLSCFAVLVQSEPTNTANIRVGSATSQSMLIRPGETETLPYCGNIADIYVRAPAAANQRVNWHAMR